MYRILTFDGGGIRGLVTLTLLNRLQQAVPHLVQNTDFLAGTSTGGIVALGLAAGKSVDDLTQLYQNNGKTIFDDSWLRDIVDLGNVAGARYSADGLQKLLKATFGDLTLDQLGKRVMIPTFELDNGVADPLLRAWSPVFFHNFPGSDSDGAELAAEIALRTSAAPTYFPTHGAYVDGGVVANNPSMAALAQTQDPRTTEARPAIADIRLLSLGTGGVLSFISGSDHNWGLAQWAQPLVNLLLDASMGIADYQCQRMLQGNYQRLAPPFPPGTNIKLDDWERAGDLIAFANGVDLKETIAWLGNVGW